MTQRIIKSPAKETIAKERDRFKKLNAELLAVCYDARSFLRTWEDVLDTHGADSHMKRLNNALKSVIEKATY